MAVRTVAGRIAPERWPTERPLFAMVLLSSMLIWLFLVVSLVGAIYAVFIGLFFFVSQLAFVSYIRGSAVRLGPNQFPELHAQVVELSRAMEMEPPATYLMQAGGSLNAFATRFLRRSIVVLYSDLLEACGENHAARDMIITHELAHLRCGHLNWLWLTLPGYFVPFLGSALSRAREYTCDRFGLMGAGDSGGAVHGLTILSAGPKLAPEVNLEAFVRQQDDLNSGFMTLGEWLGSHPPLSKRIAALDSSLADPHFQPTRGRASALMILVVVMLGGVGSTVALGTYGKAFLDSIEELQTSAVADEFELPDPAVGAAQVETDFAMLSEFIAAGWSLSSLPETLQEVRDHWASQMAEPFPTDPFDGYDYGFDQVGISYRLWSSGPDGMADTADDLSFEFPSS